MLLLCTATFGQRRSGHTVSARLLDKDSGEPIPFATVSITPAGATKSSAYTLSADDGQVSLDKVRPGSYTLKAELMGYKPLKKEIKVEGDLYLGELKMEGDREQLDAAKVTAMGNPIIIKKDTVEYNASSFKTTDNDVLEDLLKKLPGVEVAEDGSITWNGETIKKITIDGKTFFLDDPQIASKNLPAKLIEKVKVVKKKSEQAEFTGIDDGEEETIIDLGVQKGRMRGFFGNAMAGAGHDLPSTADGVNDLRYQTSLMTGRFTNDSQISIIGNLNNTNNRGFNDMAGSMMNTMMGGGGGMGRRGGGGGFGRSGNGITTSWMLGGNGNWDLFGDKMDLGGNYMYSGSKNDILEDTYKETYMTDGSTQKQDNEGVNVNRTDGHRLGVRLEHKFSDNTSILFQPQLNFGRGAYSQANSFDTWTDDASGQTSHTNRGFSANTGDNRSFSTNGFMLLRQKLGMPGRTISLNVDWSVSHNELDGYNQSVTETFEGKDPTLINQLIDQVSNSSNIGGRLVYTEPLGAGFYAEASYQYRWNLSESVKDVYNSLPGYENDYDIASRTISFIGKGDKDEDYSSQVLNRYINQSAGLAIMYQEDKLRAQLGFSANPTNTHNETNGQSYDNNVVNWAPRAMLFYDFTENSNARLFYFGRSGQPSTSQLMPVLDNSNPLSMSLGNPYLTPYFDHNVRGHIEYSNKKSFITARLNLRGGYNQSPIVNAIWYDLAGRQYSFPVNGNDAYSANARIMLSVPLMKTGLTFSNMTNVGYSKSGSYIGNASIDMSEYWDAGMTSFDYEAFHAKYPDMNATEDFLCNTTQTLTITERVRATYRNDNIELGASARTRMSKPWYTITTSAATTTWNNQVNGSINWTVGDTGLELTTDADYNWYRGYTTPQDPQLIWNASASMQILQRKATIALRAYDILDQARNLSVTDTANYHSEVHNNTLGRYIILSFTLRFGNFGKAREQMRGRGGMGGPGGFGGGPGFGGPPMGRR